MRPVKHLLMAVLIGLGGCAWNSAPPSAELKDIPARYMQGPIAFPTVKPGDYPVDKLAEAAAVHATNVRTIKGLQQYVRLIRRQRE